MIIVIGEILMDIFPEYERLGGAPFNFAYHLKQMGVPVRFVSRVGADQKGDEILDRLRQRGFDISWIQKDPDYPTGRVEVTPDATGGHEFYIVENVAYDRIELPDHPDSLSGGNGVELIYFGTLVQRTAKAMERLQAFLENKDAATVAFYDVNLRQNAYSKEIIHASLGHTDYLKLNADELVLLGEMFAPEATRQQLPGLLMERFGIRNMAVTRGSSGSMLVTPEDLYEAGVPEIRQVQDTVGAGDAYAAMLVVGYLNGWPSKQTLETASRFAGDICTIAGAVPDAHDFYEPYLKLVNRK